jgi:hypothetical protein
MIDILLPTIKRMKNRAAKIAKKEKRKKAIEDKRKVFLLKYIQISKLSKFRMERMYLYIRRRKVL